MTVVVGILNKKGVAIAADSATSNRFTNKEQEEADKDKEDAKKDKNEEENMPLMKVFNSGNKMLRLSDKMPIGVMIVNYAQIAGIPWDVIIRWYRKQLGETTFPTVEDAAKDLLRVLEDQEFFNEASRVYVSKPQYASQLIFAGYGADQKYPQLVQVDIKGVIEEESEAIVNGELVFQMKYRIRHNIPTPHTISDDTPSQICYFGQKNIAAALTDDIDKNTEVHLFCSEAASIIFKKLKEYSDDGLINNDNIPEHHHFQQGFLSVFKDYNEDSHQVWLDSIRHYTLQEMAALAENLINATELYHKLMCLDESVGGLIDLAVITREDGFQWLNRKSWYEPSRGGQYGKFGI